MDNKNLKWGFLILLYTLMILCVVYQVPATLWNLSTCESIPVKTDDGTTNSKTLNKKDPIDKSRIKNILSTTRKKEEIKIINWNFWSEAEYSNIAFFYEDSNKGLSWQFIPLEQVNFKKGTKPYNYVVCYKVDREFKNEDYTIFPDWYEIDFYVATK